MIALFTDGFERAGLDPAKAHELGVYYLGILQSLQLMAHARTDEAIVRQFTETALKELKHQMH